MLRTKSLRLSAALLLAAAVTVAADGGDDTDFILNVFSDLGPILALFGEQFARQFLSESFTIFDHLIFACVPLGIMTAVAGAIRVQGPKFAKAFIGHARENRAAAEIDYMSSTSGEVCELFNGTGIVRTMGRPEIAQLIIFSDKFPDGDSCGIHTLRTAIDATPTLMAGKKYHESGSLKRLDEENDQEPLKEDPGFLKSPNLQLNVPSEGISPDIRTKELRIAAALAVTLQISLLVIAGLVAYHNPEYGSQPWGLPCYLIGSVLLFLGMLICSAAIEKSTVEFIWQRHETDQDKSDGKFELLWVQRKQLVSDQNFHPYIISGGTKTHILTSSRSEDVNSYEKKRNITNKDNGPQKQVERGSTLTALQKSLPFKKRNTMDENCDEINTYEVSQLVWTVLTLGGAFAGGIGFTVQFIGLRGLPWPCGVSHLGALFIMALIRALIRHRLGEVPGNLKALEGFELDFLTTRLVESKCQLFPTKQEQTVEFERITSWRVKTAEKTQNFPFIEPEASKNDNESKEEPNQESQSPPNISQQLIKVRERLGGVCKWTLSTSKPALALTLAIERFMKDFVNEEGVNLVNWNIPCIRVMSNDKRLEENLCIQIQRPSVNEPSNDQTKRWEINFKSIEAILSLWMAQIETESMKLKKKEQKQDRILLRSNTDQRVNYCRIIGHSDLKHALARDIEWWVKSATITEIGAENEPDGNRSHSSPSQTNHIGHENIELIIGFTEPLGEHKGDQTDKLLVQHSSADLANIASQHLFTNFIWTIACQNLIRKDFLNRGTLGIDEFVKIQPLSTSNPQSPVKFGFSQKLSHTKLTAFLTYAEKEGLGTSDDVLLCMIPAFSFKDLLPNDVILRSIQPRVLSEDRRRWVQICRNYQRHLDSMVTHKNKGMQDYLALATVVNTMEFVYFITLDLVSMKQYQKPTKNKAGDDEESVEKSDDRSVISTSKAEEVDTSVERTIGRYQVTNADKSRLPQGFDELLSRLSETFSNALEKLSPFYDLQGRKDVLSGIFRLCLNTNNNTDIFSPREGSKPSESNTDFMEHIGFGHLHQQVYQSLDGAEFELKDLIGMVLIPTSFIHNGFLLIAKDCSEDGKNRDIFGWTAFHYAAARPSLKFTTKVQKECHELLEKPTTRNFWFDKYQRTPIHIAASCGNDNLLSLLQEKIQAGEAIPAMCSKGLNGMTPMHLAIEVDDQSCVEALLKLMLPDAIMQVDAWKRTPVHVGALKQSDACLRVLLDAKNLNFNPESLDASQKTALSYLDNMNQTQKHFATKLLLNHWKSFEAKDGQGQTILHYAIDFLASDDLDELLRGSNLKVDAMNKAGKTPLYLAIESKNQYLAKVLLNHEADPLAKIKKGPSPMMLACQLAQVDVVKSILNSNKLAAKFIDENGKTGLHDAIKAHDCSDEDREEMVKSFANVMENVDAKEQNGSTALHEAVRLGNMAIISILLNAKASPITKDRKGLNALHHAIRHSDTSEPSATKQIMEKLLDAMPDCLSEQDNGGNTPLHRALDLTNDNAAVLLLSKGARVDVNNSNGDTPLIIACRRGICFEFIEEVVNLSNQNKLNGNINQGDSQYDESALAWACEHGQIEVITHLLKTKALDLTRGAKNWRGFTPLHIALYEENLDVLKLLLDDERVQTSWEMADKDGHKPVNIAIRYPNEECLKELFSHMNAGPKLFSLSELESVTREYPGSELEEIAWRAWKANYLTIKSKRVFEFPLHRLVEDGSLGTIESIFERTSCNVELDGDNWTPSDVAGKCGHVELMKYLQDKESKAKIDRKPYREPSSFMKVYENTGMNVSSCNLHNSCQGILLDAEIRRAASSVEILKDVQAKNLAIGFCQSSIRPKRLPGWDHGSWAYHGDDGGLYVESGDEEEANRKDEYKYAEGDVVGCGLDCKTGKGYRTLNGKLLDCKDAFEDTKFTTGRFYPCIGFMCYGEGDTVQLLISLRNSEEHPFRYKGPSDRSDM